jgi:hypothetical protein
MPVRESLSSRQVRRTTTFVSAGITAAAFVTACASAQSIKSGSFIAPRATIVCRQVVPTPSDSADFIYDFMDGRDSLGQRTVLAAYDSSGKPLYMVVSVRSDERSQWPDMFAVRFYPTQKGGRVPSPSEGGTLPGNASGHDSISVKSVGKEMTLAEIEDARHLAQWYWAHRCKGS